MLVLAELKKFCFYYLKNFIIFFKLSFYYMFNNRFSSKKKNLGSIFMMNHIITYPTPSNLSYFWNFGSLAGFCLMIQLLTGIFLAMNYNPSIFGAFDSVDFILSQVNFGWLLRFSHANGAAFFLTMLYIHISRGIFYKSFNFDSKFVWLSGVLIFLLVMGAAFLGYVCVAGQMSYWGATVIIQLLSAMPQIGTSVVYWLWGDFSVGNATMNRLFTLHFLLPFIMVAISLMHILFLHEVGSSNFFSFRYRGFMPINLPFYPYFMMKDLFGYFMFFAMFFFFVTFLPDILNHPDNYIPANPLVTPSSMVPEFYFLSFYCILSSIPDKLGGVLMMGLAIMIFAFLPIMSFIFNLYKLPNKIFILNMRNSGSFDLFCIFLLLGWLGGQHAEDPYIICGQILTLSYFMAIFFL